jgi:hypothetical protein
VKVVRRRRLRREGVEHWALRAVLVGMLREAER